MPAGKGSGDYGGIEVLRDDLIRMVRWRLNERYTTESRGETICCILEK